MKKFSKYTLIIISIILGIVMILAILKQIPFNEVKQAFQSATPLAIIGFLLVSITMMFLFTWRWQIITDTKKRVPILNLLQYKIVGYGISFITPVAKAGGEPLRAMLLQKEGFSFKEGLSTIAIDKIVDLTTSGFLFIIGILVAITTFALPEKAEVLLMVFIIVIIALIIWFYLMLIGDKNVLQKIFKLLRFDRIKKLKKFEKDIIEMDVLLISFYKHHKKSFNKVMILSSITWLLMFLEYQFALMIVGIQNVSFAGLFLIITMMGTAYLIPVPLALGVLEAGQISIFSLLKLSSASAVGLATIIRARDLLWTLIGVTFLLTHGINFKKAYDKSIKKETISSNNK
ncbi:flippase-like domain-containing protein [Candidatus Woesearchaeota archaeon]|nr:flippase-like domain-containing protein [Candidatus Woesearchaeota archaeon]